MKTWRKICGAIGALLILLSLYIIPYYAASRASEAAHNTATSKQAVANIQTTANGIKSLLAYVASIQSGPQSKALRDSTAWYITEFQAICAATPGCKQVPLPPELRG